MTHELHGSAINVGEVPAGEDVVLQTSGMNLAVFEQKAVCDAG